MSCRFAIMPGSFAKRASFLASVKSGKQDHLDKLIETTCASAKAIQDAVAKARSTRAKPDAAGCEIRLLT
jgi:hypothetical protein